VKAIRPALPIGNAGLIAFTSAQHLRFVEESELMGVIDCLVILMGINDFLLGIDPYHFSLWYRYRSMVRATPIWHRSRVLALGREAWNRYAMRDDFLLEDPTGSRLVHRRLARLQAPICDELPNLDRPLKEYGDQIRRMIDRCRAKGVRPVFATQPVVWKRDLSPAARNRLWQGVLSDGRYLSVERLREGMDRYNDALLAVCREKSVECIDLTSMNGQEQFFYDDCHYNEAGAREVARLIARWFMDHRGSPHGDGGASEGTPNPDGTSRPEDSQENTHANTTPVLCAGIPRRGRSGDCAGQTKPNEVAEWMTKAGGPRGWRIAVGMNGFMLSSGHYKKVYPIGEVLDFCRKEGFEGVELVSGWPMGPYPGPDETSRVDALRRFVEGYDLKIHSIQPDTPGRPFAESAAERTQWLEAYRGQIALCKRLGGDFIGQWPGGPRGNQTIDQAIDHCIASYREAAKICADTGMWMSCEIEPPFVFNTLDHLKRILEGVDHPACKTNFDPSHFDLMWGSKGKPHEMLKALGVKHIGLRNRWARPPDRGCVTDLAGSSERSRTGFCGP